MTEKDVVTRTIQVLDILPGEPPRILTGERLRKGGRPGRMFQQMIPVPDAGLFSRFAAHVCKGDTVEVTVTTEWHDEGYATYLSGFAAPASTGQTRPVEPAVKK